MGRLQSLRSLPLCLYILSALGALVVAFILHKSIKDPNKNIEAAEEWYPYRLPSIKSVFKQSMRQAGMFLKGRISDHDHFRCPLGLGFMGPGSFEERTAMDEGERLEQSWLGEIGNAIEPVKPLGYDGKMGIAILSSFAAREVFVGTMQTLYPTEDGGSIKALKQRLTTEILPGTDRPLFNVASAASLIVFYMFAMQCISTIVIVRRELGSWGIALAQALGYTAFAYLAALLTFRFYHN